MTCLKQGKQAPYGEATEEGDVDLPHYERSVPTYEALLDFIIPQAHLGRHPGLSAGAK